MAKTRTIVKRKKRRLNWFINSFIFMMFSIMLTIGSSIFVKNNNSNYTVQIQKVKAKIEVAQAENNSLQTQVRTLSNDTRVYSIATDAGLAAINENVVNVLGNDEE